MTLKASDFVRNKKYLLVANTNNNSKCNKPRPCVVKFLRYPKPGLASVVHSDGTLSWVRVEELEEIKETPQQPPSLPPTVEQMTFKRETMFALCQAHLKDMYNIDQSIVSIEAGKDTHVTITFDQ